MTTKEEEIPAVPAIPAAVDSNKKEKLSFDENLTLQQHLDQLRPDNPFPTWIAYSESNYKRRYYPNKELSKINRHFNPKTVKEASSSSKKAYCKTLDLIMRGERAKTKAKENLANEEKVARWSSQRDTCRFILSLYKHMQEDIFKNMHSVSTKRSAVDDPKELNPKEQFFDAVIKTFNSDKFEWDFPAEIQSRENINNDIKKVDKENMNLIWDYIQDKRREEGNSLYYPLTREKAETEYMKLNSKYLKIDSNIGKSGMHSADYKSYNTYWEKEKYHLLYYYMMKEIQKTVFGDLDKQVNVGTMRYGMSSENSSSSRKRKRRKKQDEIQGLTHDTRDTLQDARDTLHILKVQFREDRTQKPLDAYDREYARDNELSTKEFKHYIVGDDVLYQRYIEKKRKAQQADKGVQERVLKLLPDESKTTEADEPKTTDTDAERTIDLSK